MTTPIRTCIGCRARRPQPELVRITADGSGGLLAGRRNPGRGAWLCADTYPECGATALERRAFGRALRTDLSPGVELPPTV